MKKLLVIIILVLALSLVPSIEAQDIGKQIMSVSPVILNISLSPNKEYTYQITVKNFLNEPLPLKAKIDNLNIDEEDTNSPLITVDSKSPLIEWTSIDPGEMIIPPKEERTISVTITIPQKVPVGGYYGVLFLEPVVPVKITNTSLVSTRVGVVMLANVGVSSPNSNPGEIVDFSFDKFIYENNTAEVLLRFKNTSLHHFSAKPQIEIKPWFGNSSFIPLEEKYVFPGKVRRWSSPLDLQKFSIGLYKTKVLVSIGSGKVLEKEQTLVIFPVKLALAILFVLVILLFAIFKKDRIKKAFAILVQGQ